MWYDHFITNRKEGFIMKKIIAFLLAALMCLSLCACAGEEASSRKKDRDKDKGEEKNSYEEYEELLKYLEAENYEAALYYVQELYDEQQANLPDVPADAEEQYQHVLWALECYEDGSGVWIEELDKSLGGSELIAYEYERLMELGDYKDCKELLDRITIVKDLHLSTVCTDVDNLGNESQYGSVRIYNEQGQLVTLQNPMNHEDDEHIYGYDFWGHRYYSYDASGVLSTIECGYIYDNSKDINAVIRYNYDDAGRLVKLESDTASGESYLTEYTYDEQGRVTKITCTGGYYSYATEYTYNENGCLVKEVREEYYSSDMDLVNRTTFEYTLDENGVATQFAELHERSYSTYSKSFYNTQTNVHDLTVDSQGRVVSDSVTYGKIIDRDGKETKPDYVSGVYTYTYGDYYFYG